MKCICYQHVDFGKADGQDSRPIFCSLRDLTQQRGGVLYRVIPKKMGISAGFEPAEREFLAGLIPSESPSRLRSARLGPTITLRVKPLGETSGAHA